MKENKAQMSQNNTLTDSMPIVMLFIIVALFFALSGCSRQQTALPTATLVAEVAPHVPEDGIETEQPTPIIEDKTTEKTLADDLTQEPDEVPTEESLAALPPDPQEVAFEAEDGQVLEGHYYPAITNPASVIILMHWAPGNMDDWNEIAFWLQNRGLSGSSANVGQQPWLDPSWFPAMPEEKSYAVFTFSFRNGSREQKLLDAQAAFRAVHDLEGVDPLQILSLGASIGADGAPDGCFWHNEIFGDGCLGVLSLSPGSYLTVAYNEAVDKLGSETLAKPAWCFYATDDAASSEACQSASGEHYRMVEWQGGTWHGMELLDPARDPNAMQLILEWLALLDL